MFLTDTYVTNLYADITSHDPCCLFFCLFFSFINSWVPSECQAVCIAFMIEPVVLSVLIWVEAICNDFHNSFVYLQICEKIHGTWRRF